MTSLKIVVTGGPSGGKTTLIEALKKELGPRCAVVTEAASILYRGGFPRLKSNIGRLYAQRAIYSIQKELESLITFETKAPLIVCDRGSLDSVAYWPNDGSNFFDSMSTNEKYELQRYDWVIHLDTASANHYDPNNQIRTENYQEAQILNNKIRSAWSNHPHRVVISQNNNFLSKMTTALAIIKVITAFPLPQEAQVKIAEIMKKAE